MGRPSIGGVKVQVLVPDDVLAAIDDLGVKRSAFIRDAIAEKLGRRLKDRRFGPKKRVLVPGKERLAGEPGDG